MPARILAILLIFAGEVFSIGAQLLASKRVVNGTEGAGVFLMWMLVLGAIGGVSIVAGYILGYLHFKNIWVVTAISIGSIVVFEPILALILFKQVPTMGAAIGIVLGVLGIISALTL